MESLDVGEQLTVSDGEAWSLESSNYCAIGTSEFTRHNRPIMRQPTRFEDLTI